jgi:maltooligosyltrehalose trehalohydrolase
MKVGSEYLGNNKCRFTVWAPIPDKVELKIVSHDNRIIPLQKNERDYWAAEVENIPPGTLYKFILNGEEEYPDPASCYQPEGVHGPSQVIDHNSFIWSDEDKNWQGIEKNKLIIYELHVGTFTQEGTFEAIIDRLDDLTDLGINTIELMPVSSFPGERNWGYDGVYKFSVQNSYGGPDALKKLVNECHKKGIAVCLDVVYNHFGPEGNYTEKYGYYLTERYNSPWGDALNFDAAYGTDVGNFFIENALFWFKNYHIDILRLDAIHTIYDISANHILKEIAEAVDKFSKEQGRKFLLIAESDLNDSKVLKPLEMGGYALDGQWSDDFHHSLWALLTGEAEGYYMDFGRLEHFKKAMEEGYAYSSVYSKHRKRNHGNSPKEVPADCFVVFCQNHDQVGNRLFGERISHLISIESVKLAAGAYILSPYIPLIFMGEEYAENNPFLYFVSHSDKALVKSVREGRKEEFSDFNNGKEPPDPMKIETFNNSKLSWKSRNHNHNGIILNWYKTLIKLRKTVLALSTPDKESMSVYGDEEKKYIILQRWDNKSGSHVYILINFSNHEVSLTIDNLPESDIFIKILDSSDRIWGGEGSKSPEQLLENKEIILNGYELVIYKKDGI